MIFDQKCVEISKSRFVWPEEYGNFEIKILRPKMSSILCRRRLFAKMVIKQTFQPRIYSIFEFSSCQHDSKTHPTIILKWYRNHRKIVKWMFYAFVFYGQPAFYGGHVVVVTFSVKPCVLLIWLYIYNINVYICICEKWKIRKMWK